jgi:hypothetical protein
MARLKQLIVDCHDPAALALFWASALDEFTIRPYDGAEIARLATLGLTPETDPCVILDGPILELCFQKVDFEYAAKRPLHMHIATTDRRAEVNRLVSLGAAVRQDFDQHTWMQDPEGNDFCVTGP